MELHHSTTIEIAKVILLCPLSSDPIQSVDDAWRAIFAFARRWQIEMSIRFTKSELAFECPRLLLWETRKKLFLIAALAYAFLLSLLQFEHEPLFERLINLLCLSDHCS